MGLAETVECHEALWKPLTLATVTISLLFLMVEQHLLLT